MRRRSLHRYLGWVAVIGLLAAGSAEGASPKARLEFRISLDKDTYTRSEPIHATFRLVNTGKTPVWVNTRFHLRSEQAPPEEREVVLRVTSPAGEPLLCKFDYDTGVPKTDDFTLVQPGEEAVAEHPRDLRSYFEFKDLGTYAIVGVYQNVFGQEIGLTTFTGPLSSSPVSFKLVE